MFEFLVASGKPVQCPNCKKKGFTNKSAKSCTCPFCKTIINLEE